MLDALADSWHNVLYTKDNTVTKHPYTLAYARGYYYGRAFGGNELESKLSIEDLYWRESAGFLDGLEAGRKDFEDLDLTAAAMAQDPVDVL